MDGRKYVSIAYKKAAELANVEEHVLTHQMRAIKGAIKGRIRFLSEETRRQIILNSVEEAMLLVLAMHGKVITFQRT